MIRSMLVPHHHSTLMTRMVIVFIHCILIIVLGLCLVGSMVDSLCLWKSSVLMLNAMKPCLQSVLVQQAMSPFIILRLRLRLRCQSARCSNSRPMVGHIIMVTWCSSAPIIAKSFWLSFSCGLVATNALSES